MKLFSKRNSPSGLGLLEERRVGSSFRARRTELISSEARNRLISEIKFLSSSDDFLEWFILFENQQEESIFFDEDKIDNFSLAELGYKLSDYFEFKQFKMMQLERKIRLASDDERTENYFDDYRLFDLAEITILFSKAKGRKNVISRIHNILIEENTSYQIIESLITKREGEDLKSLVNLIKDESLKTKIKRYFDFEEAGDYVSASKVSADIVNIIFSGLIKTQKRREIELLKTRLIDKLVGTGQTVAEKRNKLDAYLDNLLKTAKDLSNNIYDIRHSERSTINVSNENIYKLVSAHNMSIVELVLTTLKDDYVLSNDWESIKAEYIEKYKIDPNIRLTIKKPDKTDGPTDIGDIPF